MLLGIFYKNIKLNIPHFFTSLALALRDRGCHGGLRFFRRLRGSRGWRDVRDERGLKGWRDVRHDQSQGFVKVVVEAE